MTLAYSPDRPMPKDIDAMRRWNQSEFDKISIAVRKLIENYLLLDASNSPLTGTLVTVDVVPVASNAYSLGTLSFLFKYVYASTAHFVKVRGAIPPNYTLDSLGSYGVFVNSIIAAGSTGTLVCNSSYGGVVIGTMVTSVAGQTAELRSLNGGAVIGHATVAGGGAWTATAESIGFASTCFGRAVATSANAYLGATATASFCNAFAFNATALSRGLGSFLSGYSATGGLLDSGWYGTFVSGFASSGGSISALSIGDMAGGYSPWGPIVASGGGSIAWADTTTSGVGATCSGNNSMQLGPGINAVNDSLQVGNGIRIFTALAGPPAGVKNGDIWLQGTDVWVRALGVNRVI